MDTDDPELVGLDEEFLGKIFYDKDNKTHGGAWFVIDSVVWTPESAPSQSSSETTTRA